MKLARGMRIRLTADDPKVWEVESLNQGSATIRCLSKKERTFTTAAGEDVSFSESGDRLAIALDAAVFLVEGENR